MPAFMKNLAAATLLATSVSSVSAQASGSGTTTRYWDCCKPSCSWDKKADVSAPVGTCDIDDNPLDDQDADSGCEGGPAFMCSNNSPWAVDEDLAYGYAAVSVEGGDESSWCCACFELTFTSGPVSGKKMVVQGVNTGADLSSNQFDIAMPGGGVGIFNGCSDQWGAPEGGWGEQYGGITSNTCPSFPEPLVDGCEWRFDWFQNADNPDVEFEQVQCPAEITEKTGCTRSDEGNFRKAQAPRSSGEIPVHVPGAASSVSSSIWSSTPSSSATWVTSPLVRRQWPIESTSSSSTPVTPSSSTPSSTGGWPWPTEGWPWPFPGDDDDEHEHVRRQDWPEWPSSSSPSSTPASSTPSPTGGWPWPTEGWPWPFPGDDDDEHEHVRRQDWPEWPEWPSSSSPSSTPASSTPSPTGEWPWPTEGWPWPGEDSWPPRKQNNNVRRQWWSSSSSPSSTPSSSTPSPTGEWPWPTEGWPWPGEDSWPPRKQNNNVRRQWWSSSPTPTPSWSWSWSSSSSTPTPSPTDGWSQEQEAGHVHERRQEWPPFSWSSSTPTPSGTPTGSWSWPTGGWPLPTGGFPTPTGGWPWPFGDDGGFEDEE